jgi:hypothetical protein
VATAIARTFTGKGFVIAADRRSTNTETGEHKDETQKIHQFGSGPLAASFFGAGRLGSFDFLAEIPGAAQAKSPSRFHTLQDYATAIAGKVQNKLVASMETEQISLPSIPSETAGDDGDTILVMHIDGYYSDRPASVRVRFRHKDQKLLPPDVSELLDLVCLDTNGSANVVRTKIVAGIPEIAERINSNDSSMRAYMIAADLDESSDPEATRAVNFSSAFIRACAGPEAQKIDPVRARTIGGTPCIATVTPEHGFRWVPGFGKDDK